MIETDKLVYEKECYRVFLTPDGCYIKAKDDKVDEWFAITGRTLTFEKAVSLVESNLKLIKKFGKKAF